MKYDHLIGVDPGITTGLAEYYAETDYISTETIHCDVALIAIAERHKLNPIDAIAIERFATAGKLSKYGLATIDLIGQIKGWAYATGVLVYIFAPQSRKAWQGYTEATVHQNDARAHLLHMMRELNVESKYR